MGRAVAILVLVAGCELVFPHEPMGGPPPPDGASPACAPTAPDEDSDTLADACDLCPHLPGPLEDRMDVGIDGDGDRIGDRCDPDPGVPAQGRWFDGMNAVDRWDTAAGWSFDGAARSPTPATDLLAVDSFGRVHVELGFQYSEVPAAAPVVFGVWAAAAMTGRGVPDGYACVAVRAPTAQTSIAIARSAENQPGDQLLIQIPENLDISPGAAHVIRLNMLDGGELVCRLYSPTGELEGQAQATDATFTAGRIGVRADDVGAAVSYVFVVEH